MDTIQEFKSHLHTDPDRLVHPQGSDCHIKAGNEYVSSTIHSSYVDNVDIDEKQGLFTQSESLQSRWIFIFQPCKIRRHMVDVSMLTLKMMSLMNKLPGRHQIIIKQPVCFPKSFETVHSMTKLIINVPAKTKRFKNCTPPSRVN